MLDGGWKLSGCAQSRFPFAKVRRFRKALSASGRLSQKKSDIFPGISEKDSQNSFFDENEFSDLSNYMDDKNNKNWF